MTFKERCVQALSREGHSEAIQKALAFRTPVKAAQWPPVQEFCYDPYRADRCHPMMRLKKLIVAPMIDDNASG